jgi:hypothetical protein
MKEQKKKKKSVAINNQSVDRQKPKMSEVLNAENRETKQVSNENRQCRMENRTD